MRREKAFECEFYDKRKLLKFIDFQSPLEISHQNFVLFKKTESFLLWQCSMCFLKNQKILWIFFYKENFKQFKRKKGFEYLKMNFRIDENVLTNFWFRQENSGKIVCLTQHVGIDDSLAYIFYESFFTFLDCFLNGEKGSEKKEKFLCFFQLSFFSMGKVLC